MERYVGTDPVEMAKYIAYLEGKVKNNKPKTKQIEVLVTLETGEVQIKNLTPNAITFPANVWPTLFEQAVPVMNFIEKHQHILAHPADDEIAVVMKRKLRETELADGSPVIRKPKAKSVTIAEALGATK